MSQIMMMISLMMKNIIIKKTSLGSNLITMTHMRPIASKVAQARLAAWSKQQVYSGAPTRILAPRCPKNQFVSRLKMQTQNQPNLKTSILRKTVSPKKNITDHVPKKARRERGLQTQKILSYQVQTKPSLNSQNTYRRKLCCKARVMIK